MSRAFTLYPREQHWWSFNDYGAVLDVVASRHAKRVVEFGPGSSTLALIEGGATHVDSYEDQADWLAVYRDRLERRFPEIVRLHPYTWADPLVLERADPAPYDLALIDGPHGTLQRPAVLRWCVAHMHREGAILMPTEEMAYGRSALRPHIEAIAEACGLEVAWMPTGPLSGSFALLTHPHGTDLGASGQAPVDANEIPQTPSRRARRKTAAAKTRADRSGGA